MAAELAEILESADPLSNPFLNHRRAEELEARLARSLGTEEAIWYRVQLATELLSAGRTRDAIAQFQTVLEAVRAAPDRFPARTGFEGNWLTLRLLGEESNRMAIGARIDAFVREEGGTRQIQRVVTSGGSFGGNPFR